RHLLLEQPRDRLVGGLHRLGSGARLGGGLRGGGTPGDKSPGQADAKSGDKRDRAQTIHGFLWGRRPPARNSPEARSRRTTATFHWKTAAAQRARIWDHAM